MKIAAGQAEKVRITCPSCKTVFDARVPQRKSVDQADPFLAGGFAPVTNQPPAPPPSQFGPSHQPGPVPTNFGPQGNFAQQGNFGPQGNYPNFGPTMAPAPRYQPPRASNNRWLLPVLLGGGLFMFCLLLIGALLVVLPRFGNFAAKESEGNTSPNSTSNSTAASQPSKVRGSRSSLSDLLPSFDSAKSIAADLERESKRIEELGRPIVAAPTPENGEKLLAELPTFEKLALRAAKLKPNKLSAADVRNREEEMKRTLESLRNNMPQNLPPPNPDEKPFWSIFHGMTREIDPVVFAVSQLTRFREITRGFLEINSELPNPLEEPLDESWTETDRQQMYTFQLLGRFNRDYARELVTIDGGNIDEAATDRLLSLIDKYTAEAQELSSAPYLGNRRFAGVEVMRHSHYERFSINATELRKHISALMNQEIKNEYQIGEEKVRSKKEAKLLFAAAEADSLSELIDDLFFSHGKTFKPGSAVERFNASYEKERLAEEKRQAELAEAKRKQAEDAEKQRLAAEEKKRKQQEMQDKLASEKAERDKAMREQLASGGSNDPSSASTEGSTFGPSGPPFGFGGPIGPGFRGNAGPPTGPMGPGPNFPSGPSGFGPESGRAQMEKHNTDMERMAAEPTSLTINISNATDKLDVKQIVAAVDGGANYMSGSSNGKMKIVIKEFKRPIASIKEALPMLDISSVDTQKRIITAKEK